MSDIEILIRMRGAECGGIALPAGHDGEAVGHLGAVLHSDSTIIRILNRLGDAGGSGQRITTMSHRVYLAGPDVFLPDAIIRAKQMKAICARHGLTGVSPLDDLAEMPPEWQGLPEAFIIHRRNEAHIRSCAALIANLTPFRGPSADVGTIFELGFMRALGRPVFGYATTAVLFLQRTRTLLPTNERHGIIYDEAGMVVESFGLFDNLMVDGAIAASGGSLLVEEHPHDRWRDLSMFEKCVEAVARLLSTAPQVEASS